jgi:hypothetical protein
MRCAARVGAISGSHAHVPPALDGPYSLSLSFLLPCTYVLPAAAAAALLLAWPHACVPHASYPHAYACAHVRRVVTSNLIFEYILADAAVIRGFAPYFASTCGRARGHACMHACVGAGWGVGC